MNFFVFLSTGFSYSLISQACFPMTELRTISNGLHGLDKKSCAFGVLVTWPQCFCYTKPQIPTSPPASGVWGCLSRNPQVHSQRNEAPHVHTWGKALGEDRTLRLPESEQKWGGNGALGTSGFLPQPVSILITFSIQPNPQDAGDRNFRNWNKK